jgi:hypothetical protein
MQDENFYLQRRHNNGMHLTANSVALTARLAANQVVCAAGSCRALGLIMERYERV